MTAGPVPGTYWVLATRLLAGQYPVGYAGDQAMLAELLASGFDYFIDLTSPGELPPYDEALPNPGAAATRPAVVYSRRPIRDHDLPLRREQTLAILDEIDAALAADRRLYVHCRAGIGRTGLVIGCWLARRLGTGAGALEELDRLWHASGRVEEWPSTPETDAQVAYVRDWLEPTAARPPAVPTRAEAPAARYRGLLLGLAVGDALGVPVERRGRPQAAVVDLTGGGPHALPPGAWTDDTALALLLAEGLLERDGFDPADALARLRRWWQEGYLSSTGQCVGITPATQRALAQAAWTGQPYAGSHDPARATQEPLVRAGVVTAFALPDVEAALALAVDAARLTHQAPLSLDATRYYAALIAGALDGATREALTAPWFSPVAGLWDRVPLKPAVAAVAAGAWRERDGRPVRNGSAVDGLALTLWALDAHPSFAEAVLAVVSLGYQASTQGALVGQLAGAVYGESGIPAPWRGAIARGPWIAETADRLYARSLNRTAA